MEDRTRVAAYLAGLVAVFVMAWTVGNLTSPDPIEPADRAPHSPQHSQTTHH